jgi:hypothetical protein
MSDRLGGEVHMMDMDRRLVLAFGLTTVAPAQVAASPDVAASYGPEEGEEVASGVRKVFLYKREVTLAAYKWVWMTDLVFQPGSSTPLDVVPNDTVCVMLEGLVRVRLGKQEFNAERGNCDLWASPKGVLERRSNTGADVAVVRVIDLLPR